MNALDYKLRHLLVVVEYVDSNKFEEECSFFLANGFVVQATNCIAKECLANEYGSRVVKHYYQAILVRPSV